MIKTETIPMHMDQIQSSILPDIYGSSSSTTHNISPRQRALYSKHPHNFIHHHVNPGSYVSTEDRAYFEKIKEEDLIQKDAKISEYQVVVNQLQHQLTQTQQHARNMENINNDLESRLEHMAKDRIHSNNQFMKEKKKLNSDVENLKKTYDKEILRNKNLVQNVRQLEKELYMMHLRKYDYLSQLQRQQNNNSSTPRSSIKNNNEEAIALLNRQGGLPSPINVDFVGSGDDSNNKKLNHRNYSHANNNKQQNVQQQGQQKDDVEEKFRILEENAARQIVLKRTNSVIEDDSYDPVTDLAYEISRQRGRGKMVKELSFFFGC